MKKSRHPAGWRLLNPRSGSVVVAFLSTVLLQKGGFLGNRRNVDAHDVHTVPCVGRFFGDFFEVGESLLVAGFDGVSIECGSGMRVTTNVMSPACNAVPLLQGFLHADIVIFN